MAADSDPLGSGREPTGDAAEPSSPITWRCEINCLILLFGCEKKNVFLIFIVVRQQRKFSDLL